MLYPRVLVTEYQENEQHRGKADGDSQTGSEQDAGDHGKWSHLEVSKVVYLIQRDSLWSYAKYALDRSAPGI